MCTLIILRRPEHDWPLLVGANRDEMRERAWSAPARHWPDRPDVVAGLDQQAGGSWFGVNDHGLVAAVTNREGTLGPKAGRRSRGELVLEALDHAEADEAAASLAELDPRAYRGFNLFVADPRSAYWLRHDESALPDCIEVFEVPPGVHMLTARDLDDVGIARIRLHLPRLRKAPAPDPAAGHWRDWQGLLASRLYPQGEGAQAALNLDLPNGFGTVCSQLLGLPRYPGFQAKPVFLFAAGAPDRAPFEPVAL
jgi:hypothetical protein